VNSFILRGPTTFYLRAILQKRDNLRAISNKMMYKTTGSQRRKMKKGRYVSASLKIAIYYKSLSVGCLCPVQWRIQTNRLGGSQIGGAKKVFTCLNTKGCLRQSLCATQKRLHFVSQKLLFLLVDLCDFSRNNHTLKVLYIINSENV